MPIPRQRQARLRSYAAGPLPAASLPAATPLLMPVYAYAITPTFAVR